MLTIGLTFSSVERRQVSNYVRSLPAILEAGEGHEGAGYDLLRAGDITVQRRRIPGQARVQVRLRIAKVRNAPGMTANHAEQAWSDDVAARLRRVADAAPGAEESLPSAGILSISRWECSEDYNCNNSKGGGCMTLSLPFRNTIRH